MTDIRTEILKALGREDGYILDWRTTGGCQLVSSEYQKLLACPVRESRWQCEVIGEHKEHRWSDHIKAHERVGNGHSCSSVGDGKAILSAESRPTPFHVIGMFR